MRTFLRFFFRLLYHPFAFTYDLVSATVSFGRWKDWIVEVLPFIAGTRVLELGHGPGHLQRILLSRKLVAVGLDESKQMGRLAKRNSDGAARLTRGLAQQLPFASASFDTIIATFPTEYFADPQTLSEVKRCLDTGGRFIVLPAAMPKNRFLSWLFKVTEQAPTEALRIVQQRLEEPFLKADFHVETHVLDLQSGRLIIIVATPKSGQG
ncbi:MAG: methyltransferase domain-containing protein [Anaerolineales bacterium]